MKKFICAILLFVSCKECPVSEVDFNRLLAEYTSLKSKYDILLDQCSEQADTIILSDTTYIETRPNCFVCVEDSFDMYVYPNGDTVTFYISKDNPEDTIKVYEIERNFFVTNYSFRDTTIFKKRLVYKDSLIRIDSLHGNIVEISTECQDAETLEQCRARLSVAIGKPKPTATITYVRLKAYSTICEGEYAIAQLLANGTADSIVGSGRIVFDQGENHPYYIASVVMPFDSIQTIELVWKDNDCYTWNEDRNIYIQSFEINSTEYLDSALFSGDAFKHGNEIYFSSDGSIVFNLNEHQ